MGEFGNGYFYGFAYFESIGIGAIIWLLREVESLVANSVHVVYFDLNHVILERCCTFNIVHYFEVDLQIVFEDKEALIECISFLHCILQMLALQLMPQFSHSGLSFALYVINKVSALLTFLPVTVAFGNLLVQYA